MKKTAIVVGAGIAGLAAARALSEKGYTVTVIERTPQATGASIRNFGMIWPVGQPEGNLLDAALRSREIWKTFADATGLWYDECGSLHLAYTSLEWIALQELYTAFTQQQRPVQLLQKTEILNRFSSVQPAGLLGGLYCATEMIIDPRTAIVNLPAYLHDKYGVSFIWNTAATEVSTNKLVAGGQTYQADLIVICSGADFETLCPTAFAALPITKCKLQMMRLAPANIGYKLGTALCGGLSLTHYNSFNVAPSVVALKKYFQEQLPEYLQWGIHVMVCQNGAGELTVGDSHEYGLTYNPFDKQHINNLILGYLKEFALCQDWKMVETWNGVYPKLKDGSTRLFQEVESGVHLFNGLSGAGMTLSFGMAEQLFSAF